MTEYSIMKYELNNHITPQPLLLTRQPIGKAAVVRRLAGGGVVKASKLGYSLEPSGYL